MKVITLLYAALLSFTVFQASAAQATCQNDLSQIGIRSKFNETFRDSLKEVIAKNPLSAKELGDQSVLYEITNMTGPFNKNFLKGKSFILVTPKYSVYFYKSKLFWKKATWKMLESPINLGKDALTSLHASDGTTLKWITFKEQSSFDGSNDKSVLTAYAPNELASHVIDEAVDNGKLHATPSVLETIKSHRNVVESFIESARVKPEQLSRGEWLSDPNGALFFVQNEGSTPVTTAFIGEKWMKVSMGRPLENSHEKKVFDYVASNVGSQTVLSNNMVLTLLSDGQQRIAESHRQIRLLTQEEFAQPHIQREIHPKVTEELQSLINTAQYHLTQIFKTGVKLTNPEALSVKKSYPVLSGKYFYEATKNDIPGYIIVSKDGTHFVAIGGTYNLDRGSYYGGTESQYIELNNGTHLEFPILKVTETQESLLHKAHSFVNSHIEEAEDSLEDPNMRATKDKLVQLIIAKMVTFKINDLSSFKITEAKSPKKDLSLYFMIPESGKNAFIFLPDAPFSAKDVTFIFDPTSRTFLLENLDRYSGTEAKFEARTRISKAFGKKITLKSGDILDLKNVYENWTITPAALNPDHTLDYFLKTSSNEEE